MAEQETLASEQEIVTSQRAVLDEHEPVRIRVTQLSKEFRSRGELVKALD